MLDTLAGDELRRFLDSIGTPLFMIDILPGDRYTFLCLNRSFAHFTGFTAETFIGKTPEEAVPADQAARLKQHYRRCIDSGERHEFEQSIDVPAGVRWWRTTLNPIFDTRNRVKRLLATTADITDEKESHDRLRYQNLLLEAQHDLMPDGILVGGADGSILSWNSRLLEIWDMPEEVLERGRKATGEWILSRLSNPMESRERIDSLYQDLTTTVHGEELRLRDGRILEWHSRGLVDDDNIGRGRIWFFRDITDRKLIEQQLRETYALQRAILNSTSQAIVSVDTNSVIRSFNRAAEKMLGYSASEVIGKITPYAFHDPEEIRQRCEQESHRLGRPVDVDQLFHTLPRAGETLRQEWTYIHRNGHRIPVELSVTQLQDDDGTPTGFLGVATDISERITREQQLQILATTDELTNVANRRHFMASIDQLRVQARDNEQPVSVLLIDIDHFKRINDTRGHAAGDAALKATASILKNTLRTSDLLCRWGGEEFAVALDNATMPTALCVAERLRAAVESAPLLHEDKPFRMTVSIGVTCWYPADASFEAAIDQADAALYQAKNDGRNRVRVATDTSVGSAAATGSRD